MTSVEYKLGQECYNGSYNTDSCSHNHKSDASNKISSTQKRFHIYMKNSCSKLLNKKLPTKPQHDTNIKWYCCNFKIYQISKTNVQ